MFQINSMSAVPVYEQIISQVEMFVAKGVLDAGAKLPSVRNLSVTLSINPNTIQKAYSELINCGILISVPGKGIFISDEALDNIRKKGRKRISMFRELAAELRIYGVGKDELIGVIESEYGEKGDGGK